MLPRGFHPRTTHAHKEDDFYVILERGDLTFDAARHTRVKAM